MSRGVGMVVKATGEIAVYTIKSFAFTPVLAVALLGGIVGYELWKGCRDEEEMRAQKENAGD